VSDVEQAGEVVVVGMGDDHVAQAVPPRTGGLKDLPDPVRTFDEAGVHQGSLATTHEHVGGHVGEVDTGP
jgi:hypothetical protein